MDHTPMHVATDTTTLKAVAKNMNKAWLLETERQTRCWIKCPPLKSISSYLSVQLPFRLSFPHSQTLPQSPNSLSDSRVHLGSSVSKKRWHQSPASLAFLFIPLFVNTACVLFRAIVCHWMGNIFVFFPRCVSALPTLDIFLINSKHQIEWLLPHMHLTCLNDPLPNDPQHAQILSETHLPTSLAC